MDEIQRPEAEFDVPFWQPKRKLRRRRPQCLHRIDTARLQKNRERMRLRERDQRFTITIAQRLQMAEYERDAAEVGGGIASDEFDLRNIATPVHAVDQRRDFAEFFADFGDHRVTHR